MNRASWSNQAFFLFPFIFEFFSDLRNLIIHNQSLYAIQQSFFSAITFPLSLMFHSTPFTSLEFACSHTYILTQINRKTMRAYCKFPKKKRWVERGKGEKEKKKTPFSGSCLSRSHIITYHLSRLRSVFSRYSYVQIHFLLLC